MDELRKILQEGQVSQRVSYIVQSLFEVRKKGFLASGLPAVPPELDLLDAEQQLTLPIGFDTKPQLLTHLDVFQLDPDYEQHEHEYEVQH